MAELGARSHVLGALVIASSGASPEALGAALRDTVETDQTLLRTVEH